MKNFKTIISLMTLSLMLVPFLALAQQGQTSINQEQKRVIESVVEKLDTETVEQITPESVTVQNRAQVNTQNQGEEQMLRVQTQEQIMVDQQTGGIMGAQVQNQAQNQGELSAPTQNQFQGSNASFQGEQRRSMVANAVQEMLQVAERNPGIGQQISLIAQSQNQTQEQTEAVMTKVKNRGQLKNLFFGPDYKNLNLAKNNLVFHEEKISELKTLVNELENPEDVQLLNEQISIMENVRLSLAEEINNELAKPSLFGWLRRMFIK